MIQEVPAVAAMSASRFQQTLHILPDAENYSHVLLRLDLYISYPGQEDLEDDNAPIEICLVQSEDLRIQISSYHTFNPGSSVLVVTNTDTTTNRVQAIRNFIENDLNLEMDEWNVGLYGGLQYRPDEGDSNLSSVLTTYHGKAIVFLGNRFAFFGSGSRSFAELCDVRALADATLNGTTCLFLGTLGDRNYTALIDSVVFPVPYETSTAAQHITAATHFPTERKLKHSIREEKLVDHPKFDLYTVPVKTRWYRFGMANSSAEAKRLSHYMRRKFPQERFLVSSIKNVASNTLSPRESTELQDKRAKVLVVLHGHSQQLSMFAIGEPQNVNRTNIALPNASTRHHLSYFERYIVTASLPVSQRVDIAWDHPVVYLNEATTNFTINAITISLILDINLEIRKFLHKPAWPSQIPQSKDSEVAKHYLRLHFPALARLLLCHKAMGEIRPPRCIIEIFHYAEASCLFQKKRHMARAIMMPVGQRRVQLRKFLVRLIDELLTHKDFTAEEIQAVHSEARAFHSNFDISKRNTKDVIVRRASKLCQKSEHSFINGQQSAADLKTISCTNEQWNARHRAIENNRVRMRADTEQAGKALERMILPS